MDIHFVVLFCIVIRLSDYGSVVEWRKLYIFLRVVDWCMSGE